MVQVKRASVRNAILDSARDLFSERGYHGTTLLDIADANGAVDLTYVVVASGEAIGLVGTKPRSVGQPGVAG